MARVTIREVGMRDGLQSIAASMATADKYAWIDAEHGAGVSEIEVCSFVPVKLLPQFADAEDVVRHALTRPGLVVAALTPNLRGAERGFALGVHKLNFVVSVSEAHNLANVRRPVAESVTDFRALVAARNALPGGARPVLAAGRSPDQADGMRDESTFHPRRYPSNWRCRWSMSNGPGWIASPGANRARRRYWRRR